MENKDLHAVLDAIDECVVAVNSRGRIVFGNVAAERAAFPPERLPLELAARGETCDGIEVSPGVLASVRAWRDRSGELLGGVISFGPARRAEAEANLFLDSIVENVPHMIFVKDASNLRFERFNRAGEELLGIPRDRLIGRTDRDIFPKEQAEFFQARDREAIAGRQLVDVIEEPIQTRRGIRWLHTKKVPICDREGTPRYVLGISEDITERKDTEEALRRAHEELEKRVEERTEELHRAYEGLRQAQKMEAIGRLAGGVAHDFNNMLAAILGCAGLMRYSIPDDSPAREELDQIVSAAERAATLTHKLLAFSRQQVMRPVLLDLGVVVDGMADLLRRLLGVDIELTTVRGPELGSVLADPSHMEQVILNLAVNARDAMPRGGRLVIETKNVVDPPGLPRGRHVELSVADTGMGMSEEVCSRIFEPFFTTKPDGQGTGLGLSTVFGIVAQSRGEIRVESEPGRGTTFRIFLPRADEDQTRPSRPAPVVTGGTETVLLVEDEPLVRATTARMLKGLGYRVLSAESSAEALQVARSHPGPIHLLLTDVIMPGMGGRELADLMREVRVGLRVLFMSGYLDDDQLRESLAGGEKMFIAKPFTAEAIGTKIRALLDFV